MAAASRDGVSAVNSPGTKPDGTVDNKLRKHSVLKRAWDGLGLNVGMLLLMAKFVWNIKRAKEEELMLQAKRRSPPGHCNCYVCKFRVTIPLTIQA